LFRKIFYRRRVSLKWNPPSILQFTFLPHRKTAVKIQEYNFRIVSLKVSENVVIRITDAEN